MQGKWVRNTPMQLPFRPAAETHIVSRFKASTAAWFLGKRAAFLIALIAILALGAGFAAWAQNGGGNPHVPQGGSTTFPSTGTETPASGEQWDVLSPSGAVIAKASQPQGWFVSFASPDFTVSSPIPALIAPNYKVRYNLQSSNPPTGPPSTFGANAPTHGPPAGASAGDLYAAPNAPRPLRTSHTRTSASGTSASGTSTSGSTQAVVAAKSASFDVVTNANLTIPNAPSNLTATALSARRIALAWTDNSSNENGFEIERRMGSPGVWQQIATVPAGTNAYTNKNLAPSTFYTYRIRAHNQAGNSAYSNEASATTLSEPPLAPGSVGREFWLAFPGSIITSTQGHDLQVQITGEADTSGTVSVPGLGFTQPFTVTGTGSTIISIPLDAELNDADTITNLGVHIEADEPVSVSGLNYLRYQTEGFLGLPVSVLGTDYLVMAYPAQVFPSGGFKSQLSLVATEDNTTVTITPSVVAGMPGNERAAGVPFILTLNEGQTYQLQASASEADLSGTQVTSNKPVGVWGGSQGGCVPNKDYRPANPLAEQLPSVDHWGESFVSVPLASRVGGDTFRILAASDNTIVSINGTPLTPLMRGEVVQRNITGPAFIIADKPVLVAQVSNSAFYDEDVATDSNDPFMALVPATGQFCASYTFTAPTFGFERHYVNLVVRSECAANGDVILDGVPVPASSFTPLAGSEYAVAQLALSMTGGHTLTSLTNTPFGAMSYGYYHWDGYGWPVGLQFPVENGLRGEYFDSVDFISPVMTRVDSAINFNWYQNIPHVNMEQDYFSVRWTGQIIPETTETYTFVATADDGVRLWVNGQLLMDYWQDHSPLEHLASIELVAGQHYDIKVEYLDTIWRGMARLEWKTPTIPRQLVPQRCLLPYSLPGAALPSAPGGLTATASATGGQVTLAWSDNSSNESGFRIERKLGAFGDWLELPSVPENVTSFTDSGCAANTIYTYRVRSFNSHGNSAYSNQSSVGMGTGIGWPLSIVITNPTLGQVFFAPATIDVAAEAVSGPNPIVSVRFDLIDMASPATPVLFNSVTVTNAPYHTTFTNVPSRDYALVATVTDSAGNTASHSLLQISVLPGLGGVGTPPAAPTGLSATAISRSQIRLAWTDASDNESGFKIERKTGQNGIWSEVAQVAPNETRYSDNGLATHTNYVYRVRAFNIYGNSGYSNEAEATTFDLPGNVSPAIHITQPASGATFPLGTTINLIAVVSDSDGSVQSVTFKDGDTVIGQATTFPGQGSWQLPWSSASVGSHTLTAVATDNQGASTTSAPVTITITDGTGTGDFTVTITSPNNGATFTASATIPLSATANSTYGNVTQVEFFADDGVSGPVSLGMSPSTGNPWTLDYSGLPEGTYELTAEAMDDQGNWAVSDPVTVTADGLAETPDTPKHLIVVSTGSGKETLYWDVVGGAVGYNVYRSNSLAGQDYSNPVNSVPITTLSYPNGTVFTFTDTGLSNGQEYFYTVKAVFASGYLSPASREDSDVVDPQAVPWDTRDVNLIVGALSAQSGEAIEGVFRAMGPDGAVYETGVNGPSAPDASPSSDTNLWALRDGSFLTTMAEEIKDTTTPVTPITTGPVRRILSTPGFVRTTATLDLPPVEDINITPYTYPGETRKVPDYDPATGAPRKNPDGTKVKKDINFQTDDVPYIYLGSTAELRDSKNKKYAVEVDAGLVYQRSIQLDQYVWKPFIRYSGMTDPLIIATEDSPAAQKYFEAGDRVEMVYWFSTPTDVEVQNNNKLTRNVFLKIWSTFSSVDQADVPLTTSAFVKGHPADASKVMMKRCNSIAQTLSKTPPSTGNSDFKNGHRKTGTYVNNAFWYNVRLHTSNSPSNTGLLWSRGATTESLFFPNMNVINTNTTLGVFYNERVVSIDLRP